MRAFSVPGTSFLAERAVRRVAQYNRSIANLTKQGSAEPRLWIGSLESFWSGMADDFGDYLRRYGGYNAGAGPVAVAAEGPLIVTVRINEAAKTDEQVFDLPENLFDSLTSVELTTQGMFSGNRCLLRPGYHLLLEPREVTREDRACKLRFLNLPADLTAGMTLVGTVVAERTQPLPRSDSHADANSVVLPPLLVAVIQVKVI